MKSPIRGLLAGALMAWAALAAEAAPNIVFILVDDMGWGDLGVFFQNSRGFETHRNMPAFATPNLDAMAAQGLQLRRHYCSAPVCAPARASLLLGVHQGHSNVRDNQFDKAIENNHTLASVLRRAGYATALIGKWGLQGSGAIPEAHPQYRGFDYFFGYMTHVNGHYHYPKENGQPVWDGFTNNISSQLDKCYTIDLWTARAKKWIADHQTLDVVQPFFLFLSYDSPHAQLQVPSIEYPAGGGSSGGVQWTGTPGAMINTAVGTINTWIHPDYTNATWNNDNNAATPEVAWPAAAKRHTTMIRRFDDATADLLQLLRDLGIDSNTLVVFTSDNGPHNEAGNGGSYTQDPTFFDSFGPMDGIKRDTWEAGIRVPTLAWWPGRIRAGAITMAASQFHDWLPTFADVAGLPAPARTDGVSILPTLTGIGAQRPGTIYVEYNVSSATPSYAEFEAARRGATRNQEQVIHLDGYKGVRYNVAAGATPFQIYHTLNDPKEATNLAGASPWFAGLQQRMKDRVLQIRRPLSDAPRPFDADLVPPAAVSNLVSGLDYSAYEGSFPWVPDFAALAPVATGNCAGIDLSVRTRNDNIGLQFAGYLSVPVDGVYTFYLVADAGAFLRIHDASVIDADFGYTGGTERAAVIRLKAGRHPLRLAYARGAGGSPALSLRWSGPGLAKQDVPASNLLRSDPSVVAPPTAFDDTSSTPRNTAVAIDVLGNDMAGSSPGPFWIASIASPSAGIASTNLSGQIVYTPNPGFLGEDAFAYTITDGQSNATASVHVRVYFADGSLWFPFNQTSGFVTEDAGGAYSAVLSGFASNPAQWVAGRWNRALQFDGASSQVVVPGYKGILGSSNRTVAAWIKTATVGSFLCYGVKTTSQKWIMRVQNENGAAGALRVEVEGGYIVGSTDLRDGQWHHVAAVFTNNIANVANVALYVDGARQSPSAQSAQAINTAAGGDLQIGTDIQSRFFNGTIDEVRIFNRALAADEIAALCNATQQSAAAWHRAYLGDDPIDWQAADRFGYPRLLDYALGVSPYSADAAARSLRAQMAGSRLAVEFPRRLAGTSELVYTLQVSRDLSSWGLLSASQAAAVPIPDPPGFERITFHTDAAADQEPAQFVRLMIALP
ncbi:MAG TPA: sulfatase-like hydrolase/transferase [Candidatus Paceibacterota bacterium]|nr:sulfatase-like hydrolase/transferase [Verrucomicrobiota bacterium]HRZ44472.1 sulfatase-like hydrolase/transferase [Candidatus Paceibacterota bacterium]